MKKRIYFKLYITDGKPRFNFTVFNKSSFFEQLFKPTIEKLNLSDRPIGSKYMVMSLKAQINGLKLVMNRAYLIFINVKLYTEVLAKFISPSVSQFVVVALARAGIVHSGSKTKRTF